MLTAYVALPTSHFTGVGVGGVLSVSIGKTFSFGKKKKNVGNCEFAFFSEQNPLIFQGSREIIGIRINLRWVMGDKTGTKLFI